MEKEIISDQQTAENRFQDLKESKDFVQLYQKGDQYIIYSDQRLILINEYTRPEKVTAK